VNRSNSLKRHKEFRYTYRVGKSQGCRQMTMVYAKTRTHEVHVGFSVSKRIGNSVMRNRCKRRLRACFSPFLPRIGCGCNIIIVAKPDVLTAPFDELSSSMEILLKRASLLVDKQ